MEDKGKALTNKCMENDFISPENLKRPVNCSPNSPPFQKSAKIDHNKTQNDSSDSRISQENEYDFKEDQELDEILDMIPYLLCKICNFEINHFGEKEPTMLLYHIHSKLKHNSPCVSFDKCSCLSYQNNVVYDFYPVVKDPKF